MANDNNIDLLSFLVLCVCVWYPSSLTRDQTNPCLPALEYGVLTAGLPGNSLTFFFKVNL